MNKIGILGFGHMGQAIAQQLKNSYELSCFDKDKTKLGAITQVKAAEDICDLVDNSDVIILAVKPQDFDEVLQAIKKCNHLLDRLFISIAAGISTHYIEKRLGVVRVIRVMPNIAIKIGQGFSCLCHGKYATIEDFDFTENLFDYMGETLRTEEERMNAATAISGSGPAFYFDMVESHKADYEDNSEKFLKDFIMQLMKAAEESGFTHDEAILLSTNTAIAARGLLSKTDFSVTELKKQITSKGGTTEAGLEALHKTGSLSAAVAAAKKRAAELSKE